MGGKVWSRREEKFFWQEIAPLAPPGQDVTSKTVKDPAVREQWTALAVKMRDAMTAVLGPEETLRRRYTYTACYEHYFQNYYRVDQYSPNAKVYVDEYKAELQRAFGTGQQISVNHQPLTNTDTRNVALSQALMASRRRRHKNNTRRLQAAKNHRDDTASGALPKTDGMSAKNSVEEFDSDHFEDVDNEAVEEDNSEAAHAIQQAGQSQAYLDHKEHQQQVFYSQQEARFHAPNTAFTQDYARPQGSQYMALPLSALHGTGHGNMQMLYSHPSDAYGYYGPHNGGHTNQFNANAFNTNYTVPPHNSHTFGGPPEFTGGFFNDFDLPGYLSNSGRAFGNVRADHGGSMGVYGNMNGYGRSGPRQSTGQVVRDGLADDELALDPLLSMNGNGPPQPNTTDALPLHGDAKHCSAAVNHNEDIPRPRGF